VTLGAFDDNSTPLETLGGSVKHLYGSRRGNDQPRFPTKCYGRDRYFDCSNLSDRSCSV